jgi:GH18 family chitinase
MYLNDMSGKTNITHYSSYADGLLGVKGLYNPNLGLFYSNDATQADENLGGVFSWGCIRVDKNIGQDMILEYQTDLASTQPPSVQNSDTLVFLAEIARRYNKRTGVVSFL